MAIDPVCGMQLEAPMVVVNVITVRPTYLLAKDPHPKAKEIGRKIEKRIIEALREGGAQ